MKRLKRVFAVLVIFAMMLCTGCMSSNGSSHAAEQPPRYEELTALIGQKKAEVLNSLSLKETDLTETEPNSYMTPIEVKYGDVTLKVILGFGPLDDILGGITYKAAYNNEPERAAKNMLFVAKEMFGAMGKAYDENEKDPAWEMTEAELIEAISVEKNLSKSPRWYLTDNTFDSIKSYIQKLEETDLYIGHKETGMKPRFYCKLDLHAYANGAETSVYLAITYAVGPGPD